MKSNLRASLSQDSTIQAGQSPLTCLVSSLLQRVYVFLGFTLAKHAGLLSTYTSRAEDSPTSANYGANLMAQLGRYELFEQLGRGEFGIVYRVRDTALNVERAVKEQHPVWLLCSSVRIFVNSDARRK